MNHQPTPLLNRSAIKKGKRIIVTVVGGTVLAVGFALVVLPGPAFLVIPASLAILAIEFAWAKRWLRKARSFLPGKNSQKKQETLSSSSPPMNYHRDRAAASCRNAIPAIQMEMPSQPKNHS